MHTAQGNRMDWVALFGNKQLGPARCWSTRHQLSGGKPRAAQDRLALQFGGIHVEYGLPMPQPGGLRRDARGDWSLATGPSGRRETAGVSWSLRLDWLMVQAGKSSSAGGRESVRKLRDPTGRLPRRPRMTPLAVGNPYPSYEIPQVAGRADHGRSREARHILWQVSQRGG